MGKYMQMGGLLGVLGLALWGAVLMWNATGEVEMSGHGYAAMAIGIVFTFVVAFGLMGLLFFSARKGYDLPAERDRIE